MTTQAKRDYYEVLGVTLSASETEIKRAHQKLISEIRRNGGPNAIDRLLEANRARTVLMDPGKRKLYDQFGHAALENTPPSFKGFEDGLVADDELRRKFDDLEDLLVDLGIDFLPL